LLALLCCVLCVTVSFDTVIVNQILDGSLYVQTTAASMTEQDEVSLEDDDMIRPSASPMVRRNEREQERDPSGCPVCARGPGRLPLTIVSLIRALPCHSGCEHANRNGLGVPLLC
jgi:hypothetical protein